VLDEAFLDMPSYGLHPQSVLMETTWICSWFERLLKYANENTHKNSIFIADRSPFSAVFYCHYGELLEPLIRKHVEEVQEHSDIHIYTVLLRVEDEILWDRIQERLMHEPERALYKEDQREWMDTMCKFYNNFEWDIEVDNSETDCTFTFEKLMKRMVRKASTKIPGLKQGIKDVSPSLYKMAFWYDEDSDSSVDEPTELGARLDAVEVTSRSLGGGSRRVQACIP